MIHCSLKLSLKLNEVRDKGRGRRCFSHCFGTRLSFSLITLVSFAKLKMEFKAVFLSIAQYPIMRTERSLTWRARARTGALNWSLSLGHLFRSLLGGCWSMKLKQTATEKN